MSAVLLALGAAGTVALARVLWLLDPWLREAVRAAIAEFDHREVE